MKNSLLNFWSLHQKKIFIIGLPILTIIISVPIGIYYFNNQNNKNMDKKDDNLIPEPQEVIANEDQIFPKINPIDFYDYLEFKNGLPIIGDQMIAIIIKDIISRLGNVNGDLFYYIIEKSNFEKHIFFKWVNGAKEFKKTYIISVDGF